MNLLNEFINEFIIKLAYKFTHKLTHQLDKWVCLQDYLTKACLKNRTHEPNIDELNSTLLDQTTNRKNA